MSGNLESCMGYIITTFKKYAGSDKDSSTLSQDELCEMVKKEFPSLCKNEKKDQILKGIFGSMDMDGDQKVSFKEFVVFLGCLTLALEECLGGKKK
ncbi:hypothetical protein FKM82_027385 [Ascaphus truei]